MIYNPEILNKIDKADQKLWGSVIDLISDFSGFIRDKTPTEEEPALVYRCQSICRAIASQIPELTFVDGYCLGFGRNIPQEEITREKIIKAHAHSWLLAPHKAIIDPYPMGFVAVIPFIMVDVEPYAQFGYNLYVPDPSITEDVMTPAVKHETERLIKLMPECQAWGGRNRLRNSVRYSFR